MKNLKQTLFLFVLFILLSSSSVLAVDQNSTTTPSSLRQQIKQINLQKENLKTELKNLKPTLKQQLTEAKKRQLDKIYQIVLSQLSQRFSNLSQLKAKLEERITQKESQKKDMTLAKSKLAEFTQLEANYQSDLALFKSKFESINTSEVPLKSVPEIRLTANKIRSDLNLIKNNLIETIILIAQK